MSIHMFVHMYVNMSESTNEPKRFHIHTTVLSHPLLRQNSARLTHAHHMPDTYLTCATTWLTDALRHCMSDACPMHVQHMPSPTRAAMSIPSSDAAAARLGLNGRPSSSSSTSRMKIAPFACSRALLHRSITHVPSHACRTSNACLPHAFRVAHVHCTHAKHMSGACLIHA